MFVAARQGFRLESNFHASAAARKVRSRLPKGKLRLRSPVAWFRLRYTNEKSCARGTSSAGPRLSSSTAPPHLFPPGGWLALMPTARFACQLPRQPRGSMPDKTEKKASAPDAMRLEIFKNIFHSISEEMG